MADATLKKGRGRLDGSLEILGRRRFRLSQPAPFADPAAGMHGKSDLIGGLTHDLDVHHLGDPFGGVGRVRQVAGEAEPVAPLLRAGGCSPHGHAQPTRSRQPIRTR
jgi:hypothetical protein